jgi:hypothetical protein
MQNIKYVFKKYDVSSIHLPQDVNHSQAIINMPMDSESLGLMTLPIVQNSNGLENMFWKLDLFPSFGEEREAPIVLGHLERANLNQSFEGTQQSRCLFPQLKETLPVSRML